MDRKNWLLSGVPAQELKVIATREVAGDDAEQAGSV